VSRTLATCMDRWSPELADACADGRHAVLRSPSTGRRHPPAAYTPAIAPDLGGRAVAPAPPPARPRGRAQPQGANRHQEPRDRLVLLLQTAHLHASIGGCAGHLHVDGNFTHGEHSRQCAWVHACRAPSLSHGLQQGLQRRSRPVSTRTHRSEWCGCPVHIRGAAIWC
jgi:hypothetical protein